MDVVYERSGGLAGIREVLRIEGDRLEVSERGKVVRSGALASQDREKLEPLLAAVRGQTAPAAAEPSRSDSFRVVLYVDGARTLERHSVTPEAAHAGAPWDALLHALDALLTRELRAAFPDRPAVLRPDEL